MKKEREKIQIEKSFAYKWKDYPTKAAIVFVHGLSGDSQKTWANFPKLIMGSSLGQNFDVISYGHSSNSFWPGSSGLDSLISEFNSFCQSELKDYEVICFISHSLGSILVNGMLLNHEHANLATSKYISHLMITPAFLGGPMWSILSGSKTSRQLRGGSKALKSIQDDWVSSTIKDNIKSFIIYGSQDRIVPTPNFNLSDFSFHEHRIQSDHTGSPKVLDIDSGLFRGVLFAIEVSLRFNTKDSRKYYINMILKTDKSDWSYDSSKEEWILLSDFRFTIVEVSRSQSSCSFNSSFPDPVAYQCKYSFRYHGISLYEFYLWDLDGGRYLVPAPLIKKGVQVVENYNYRLAQILEAGGMYGDLDGALQMAKITIDTTKNVI